MEVIIASDRRPLLRRRRVAVASVAGRAGRPSGNLMKVTFIPLRSEVVGLRTHQAQVPGKRSAAIETMIGALSLLRREQILARAGRARAPEGFSMSAVASGAQ